MASTEVMRPGWRRAVTPSDPGTPVMGQPVRLGKVVGVAMTKPDANGVVTADFGPASYKLSVFDEATTGIAIGDLIYYDDTAVGSPSTNLTNVAESNVIFGYALGVVTANATATIEIQKL